MIRISDLPKFYLFADTSDIDVIYSLRKLEKLFSFETIRDTGNSLTAVYYKQQFNAGDSKFYFKSVVNDQKDYNLIDIDIKTGPNLRQQFDSILSYALIRGDSFIAGTDYLALFNHFYYHSINTFLCSNNLFIIAKIINAQISEEALYEILFFRFPKKEKTFFKDVKCLENFQKLTYGIKNGLELNKPAKYETLLLSSHTDIKGVVEGYMSGIDLDSNADTFCSFSGGSDSMCALAMLRSKGISCKLASYPGHDDWDTARITRLSEKLRMEMLFIDPRPDELEDLYYHFITNGLSPSSKFWYSYKYLPGRSNLFDGYNTLFGDWSDAFLYPPLKDSLKGLKVHELVNKYYKGLDEGFLSKMMDYIRDTSPDAFVDANTERGLEFARNHAVDFIPSRILSGVINCSDYFHHKAFSFQLTRGFMSYLFYNTSGVNKTFSARNDFPGPGIKEPLSVIVKDIDPVIFRMPMDHGISFRDLYFNNPAIDLKINWQKLGRKIFLLKNSNGIRSIESNAGKTVDNGINGFDFLIKNDGLNLYLVNSLRVVQNVRLVLNNLVV